MMAGYPGLQVSIIDQEVKLELLKGRIGSPVVGLLGSPARTEIQVGLKGGLPLIMLVIPLV